MMLVAAALFVPAAGVASRARAQEVQTAGPAISLGESTIRPGEGVVVTLQGWTARVVTLSVCGNLAKRGSADCNMVAARAVGLANPAEATRTEFFVSAPPTNCPCVIRASGASQDEVAVAPIDLVGVPVGPVVDPHPGPLVSVSLETRAAHDGLLAAIRSALGGPTSYEVAVSVRNLSGEALSNLDLSGSAGRGRGNEAVSFGIPTPNALSPGQTWKREVRVTLPAPVFGRFVWSVTASGAGAPVRADSSTRHTPVALVLLVMILVADIVFMIWRRIARRRVVRRRAVVGDATMNLQ